MLCVSVDVSTCQVCVHPLAISNMNLHQYVRPGSVHGCTCKSVCVCESMSMGVCLCLCMCVCMVLSVYVISL